MGSGPIFLDQVNCIGSESNILHCDMFSPIGAHMCDHTQDAGVQCEGRHVLCVEFLTQIWMLPVTYVCTS